LTVRSKGLPIDSVDEVFQRFVRGKNAWTRDETGIGVGCWAAREHMRRAGGDICVEVDGRMTVFRVFLPRGSSAASPGCQVA